MKIPTFELIVEIHEVVLEVSEGRPGIHVENDIRRASERPLTYINYVDEYDLDTICAILIDSIARYHGFEDGNKRTALMTAIFTYRANGVHFKATMLMNKRFDALVMWVVRKKPEIPEIEERLKKLRAEFEVSSGQPLNKMLTSFAKMRIRKNSSKRNKSQ
ncbi:MAG: type II toxin-antitoxin system death-on-curing family toxin [Candidatus Saccharimonadales bacterium]